MAPIKFYDPDKENGWLANFSSHPIFIGNRKFDTVEHYFQSMKFTDLRLKSIVSGAPSPGAAKATAKKFASKKRRDWRRVRNLIMYNAIKAKFNQYPNLSDALINSGSSIIVEDAEDAYWGCGADSKGKNQMGRLLMKLRKQLSGEPK